MNIAISQEGCKYKVVLNGRLDTTSADRFLADIQPLMTAVSPDITIDCTGMEYTSSQGLRIFLMLQKSVSGNGGKMVLINMEPKVKKVFDITGFSNILSII